MEAKYEIDSLDRKILRSLLHDARKPFLEIARELTISGGTVHQRVEKMQKAGVLKGFTAIIDREKLGLTVTVLIGIHLKNAADCKTVSSKLGQFPEVLEIHYTSGNYALMAKVTTASMNAYYEFLTSKIQTISAVQSTESYICMASPMERGARP